MACPVRIMIDTDPVYEQIKYAKADPRGARLSRRAHAFLHLWRECRRAGLDRAALRHPVAADPAAGRARSLAGGAGRARCFTTIATWENKGKNIEFDGEHYVWSKHVNFLRFLDLPQPPDCFTMAMLPPTPDVEAQVTAAGWRLTDPRPVSADIDAYGDFIRGSRGEFTVAKDIYVRPKSGWFSDRSVCYLASGRPVVTMATGSAGSIPWARACSTIPTRPRRSPRSPRSTPITRGTPRRRAAWRRNISPATALSANDGGCRALSMA